MPSLALFVLHIAALRIQVVFVDCLFRYFNRFCNGGTTQLNVFDSRSLRQQKQ